MIATDTLTGLGRLERLRLSSNRISTLEFGSFSHLESVQKVDLQENPLTCDCHLAWILDYMDVAGAKARYYYHHPHAVTPFCRCSMPPSASHQLLRKLTTADMTCDLALGPATPASHLGLKLRPDKPQVVFEGDSLRLRCSTGQVPNELLLRWFHNSKLVTEDTASVTNSPAQQQQQLGGGWVGGQSRLSVSTLHMHHSGNWTCSALVDTGEVQNVTISVVVINHAAVLCPSTVTNTSRGFYRWGVTLAGSAAVQECQKTSSEQSLGQPATVQYSCDLSGQWAHLNNSQCAHTSNVTEMLYSFAYMNTSDFDQNSLVLVESARQLLRFTSMAQHFVDGMDIVYLSTVLENYVPYLPAHHDLAGLMVDIAGNVMRMAPHVVSQGQLFGHAATRLLATIANISRIVPAFQHQASSLAVQGIGVSPRSFAGVTCTWYSGTATAEEKLLHCSDNNKTTASQGRSMLASVQLPATLYYQLEMLDRDVNTAKNIVFTAFQNSSLFPQVTAGQAAREPLEVVSNCVLGSNIAALEPFNLSEPVYLILGLEESQRGGPPAQPAVWDPRANNGLGSWQPDYCRLMRARRESSVFSCHRLGQYALVARARPLIQVRRGEGQAGQATHPAVWAGTAVAVLCLAASTLVYSLGYPGIGISRKLKHALPNSWLSLIFLLTLYTLAGELAGSSVLCRTLGLLLHYFILTSALWLTICASIVHTKLVNPTEQSLPHSNPYVVNPEQEVYMVAEGGKRLRKPVGRFYLAGWGLPLIICGITAGAGLPQYSAAGWCFLAPAPAAGAVLVPLLLTCLVQLYFVTAILTFSPRYPHTALLASRQQSQASLCTQSTLLVPDTEHSPWSQALALLATSLLLLLSLTLAALTTTTPLTSLPDDTQTAMFSSLYAVVTATLGLTILTYYCFLRGDLLCSLTKPCSTPEEMSNLVNLTDLVNHRSPKPVEKNLAVFPLEKVEPQVWLGGSVLGPSSGRVKQCNVERTGESEGHSSDYHSINNTSHLRRPHNLAYPGLSEFEVQQSMTDLLGQYQASKMKISNVNIHTNDGLNKVAWSSGGGGGWGAASHLTSSPMELPCPDLAMEAPVPSFQRPRDPLPLSSSLPRRRCTSRSRDRNRGAGSRGQPQGTSDWERQEQASRCCAVKHIVKHCTGSSTGPRS